MVNAKTMTYEIIALQLQSDAGCGGMHVRSANIGTTTSLISKMASTNVQARILLQSKKIKGKRLMEDRYAKSLNDC